MTTYILTLTESDIGTIAFVGGRYAWSEVLLGLDAGVNHLTEPEAWRIAEAFAGDTEGGHQPFPMLHCHSTLFAKLAAFCASIV